MGYGSLGGMRVGSETIGRVRDCLKRLRRLNRSFQARLKAYTNSLTKARVAMRMWRLLIQPSSRKRGRSLPFPKQDVSF